MSAARNNPLPSVRFTAGIKTATRPVVPGMVSRAPAPMIVLWALTASACGAGYIPNTTVEDNSTNREVVRFVERYRHAVERADIRELLELASPAYYDDNGTPVGGDDIDYDTLRDKLALWPENLIDCRYEMMYRVVEFMPDRVYVVYRYTASFRIENAEGEERWVRRLGDNRLTLSRVEDGDFRILSGM